MKVKTCILAISFLTLSNWLWAQDVQRLSERQIIGSARYVSMGGAMNAIGGDPSAVLNNPAGLGLYRRSEIALTVDVAIDCTQQAASPDTHQRLRWELPQLSAIWAWGDHNKQRGLIFSSLMFSINRLVNFNRDIVVKGSGMGMVSTICNITNDQGGLSEESLQNKPWNDIEIGWLSILGYESYLINPIDNNQWEPAVDFNDGFLSVSESGTYDQYTLAWGGNINNQWYVGLNINVPTLSYTKHTLQYETNSIHSAKLKSLYHLSGVGIGSSIGLIYRPIQSLRIGAAIHTPTAMSISAQTEGEMYSIINTQHYDISTPASGVISTKIESPLRTSIGIAGQIRNIGLLALQYDHAHSTGMDDVHTLRVGAETQVYEGVFINAGYVYESSFMKEDPVWMLGYNEMRTDMDYRYTEMSQYASAGIGYRSARVVAQIAYQYCWQKINQYATETQAIPMDVHTQTHRIVATLAWRF